MAAFGNSSLPVFVNNAHRWVVKPTTLGSATDIQSAGFRRLLVNGAYWAIGLNAKIPAEAKVDYVGNFKPTMYGFNGGKKGIKPADHELKAAP